MIIIFPLRSLSIIIIHPNKCFYCIVCMFDLNFVCWFTISDGSLDLVNKIAVFLWRMGGGWIHFGLFNVRSRCCIHLSDRFSQSLILYIFTLFCHALLKVRYAFLDFPYIYMQLLTCTSFFATFQSQSYVTIKISLDSGKRKTPTAAIYHKWQPFERKFRPFVDMFANISTANC